jgi:hypothetical protein
MLSNELISEINLRGFGHLLDCPVCPVKPAEKKGMRVSFSGSARESDEARILGGPL